MEGEAAVRGRVGRVLAVRAGRALVAAAVVPLVVTSASAHAGQGDGSDERPGFSAGVVSVKLEGDVDYSKYDSSTATVPAACYWGATDLGVDDSDTVAWAAAFRASAGVSLPLDGSPPPDEKDLPRGPADRIRFLPSGLASLDAAIATPGVRWYQQRVGNYDGAAADAVAADSGCARRDVFTPWSPVNAYGYFVQAPPPSVDIDVLVDYAFSRLLLPDPELEWNPKVKARNNSTLVNLPTWVWVEDEDATGDLQIIASTPSLRVTIDAEPLRTSVSSVASGPSCSREQLRQPYAPDVDPSKACTLTFSRPSRAGGSGFGVQTTVVWAGRYVASDGRSGNLGTREISYTTTIPVAQSQAVVTEVG